MFRSNAYTWSGLALFVGGLLTAFYGQIVLELTWVTALGVSMLIISFVLISLSRTIPRLPPEVCSLLLQTGIDNMATIIEELGIKGKAVYLPSSLTGSRPRAFFPLHANAHLPGITQTLPNRFIVRHGSHPDDVGLLFSTVGSAAFALLKTKPVSTPQGLEAMLTTLLVGTLGVAERVSVTADENHASIKVQHPQLENRSDWSYERLGSPIASIVASVATEAWDKPVTIRREETKNGLCTIELEVTGENLQ